MRYASKVPSADEAIAHIRSGSRLMLGGLVGAGKPAYYIEALLASGVGQLAFITNTPDLCGGFLRVRPFSSGQLAEFIGAHIGTTDESMQTYLTSSVRVAEFFPMGTWVERVHAEALDLGGAPVPVSVGILDQSGILPKRGMPKQVLTVDGTTCFIEPPLRANVSTIKGWHADIFGSVELRDTALQNQRGIAMVGDYIIVEINGIVEVSTILSERIGYPGVFVSAVVQGLSLDSQYALYRHH